MMDPQNPLVDAMETYGEEARRHTTGMVLMLTNSIIIFNNTEKKQEHFHFEEMPLSLGESCCCFRGGAHGILWRRWIFICEIV